MSRINIVDENGNQYGPFESVDDAIEYAIDRGLGEQRDPDDEKGHGWQFSTVLMD